MSTSFGAGESLWRRRNSCGYDDGYGRIVWGAAFELDSCLWTLRTDVHGFGYATGKLIHYCVITNHYGCTRIASWIGFTLLMFAASYIWDIALSVGIETNGSLPGHFYHTKCWGNFPISPLVTANAPVTVCYGRAICQKPCRERTCDRDHLCWWTL